MGKSSASPTSRYWVLFFCVALSGCGSNLVPVSGTVTLDGQPCAGAAVAFTPVETGAVGNGVTDGQGRFSLQTVNDPGLPPGHYRVAIILQEAPSWAGLSEDAVGPPLGAPPQKWIVPQRYASPATSGLVAEVTADSPPFDFSLTTAGQ